LCTFCTFCIDRADRRSDERTAIARWRRPVAIRVAAQETLSPPRCLHYYKLQLKMAMSIRVM
jgi:hypothetical protein